MLRARRCVRRAGSPARSGARVIKNVTKPPQRAPFRRCAASRLAARTRASCWVYLACGKHRYGITCRGSCARALGLGRRSVTARLGGRRARRGAAAQRAGARRARKAAAPGGTPLQVCEEPSVPTTLKGALPRARAVAAQALVTKLLHAWALLHLRFHLVTCYHFWALWGAPTEALCASDTARWSSARALFAPHGQCAH